MWLEEYARIRNTFDRDSTEDQKRAHAESTAFYVANREAMDAGCVVSWEGCFDPGCEVSAIQHAYNFLIDDGADVFSTECQNEPPKAADDTEFRLTAGVVASRTNGLARFAFPHSADHLTAFIDVQGTVLYYVVCAWELNFTGYVIDYGSFPQQPQKYFRLIDAHRTLALQFPGSSQESQWYEGLTALCRPARRARVAAPRRHYASLGQVDDRCQLRRIHRSREAVLPDFAMVADSAGDSWPWHQSRRRADGPLAEEGRRNSRLSMGGASRRESTRFATRGLRRERLENLSAESFRAQSAVAGQRLVVGGEPREHEMYADQVTSEKPIRTEGRGRTVLEWVLPANRPDNHFLDCTVGAAVWRFDLGC